MKKRLVAAGLVMSVSLTAAIKTVALQGKSPLVTFRIVFLTGAASEAPDKAGVAALTAAMLAGGGTRQMSYKQVVDAMFPMATSVEAETDKEMISFSAVTHVDNLEAFYKLFHDLLLDPGWRQDDFTRLRDDSVNFLRVGLRGNNDEELGKEVLYNEIYAGHPYGRHNLGTVSSLQQLTVADVQHFYHTRFTQQSLTIGIAGGYPEQFLERMKRDFEKLPKGEGGVAKLPEPQVVSGMKMVMVEKDTRSVAFSMGFPIDVTRGHPDYTALLLAQSYFGQHRMSGGRLYSRLRQLRGLNYGDYAYIEYFPRGMFLFEPEPNLARRQQIFQIWTRPVEPATAHFALRLTLFEFDKLVREGLSREDFERTRSFLAKHVNLLIKTKGAELGYAIDSRFYNISDYPSYIKNGLAKLTVEDVNRAIRKHLGRGSLTLVVVAKNCQELKNKILAGEPSPMTYNSPKPGEVLEEDKIVERWKIELRPERIQVVPLETVFE